MLHFTYIALLFILCFTYNNVYYMYLYCVLFILCITYNLYIIYGGGGGGGEYT